MVCDDFKYVIFELTTSPIGARVKRAWFVTGQDFINFSNIKAPDNLRLFIVDPSTDLTLRIGTCRRIAASVVCRQVA